MLSYYFLNQNIIVNMSITNGKKSLEMLLMVNHKNDMSDDPNKNIHLYAFALLYHIVNNDERIYKSNNYYKKSKAFKELCDDIHDNLPRTVFVKDGMDCWKLNEEHKKHTLCSIYLYTIEHVLVQLGF